MHSFPPAEGVSVNRNRLDSRSPGLSCPEISALHDPGERFHSGASQLQWWGENRLLYLGEQVHYLRACSGCPVDTLRSGLESAAILRLSSGLPFSRTNAAGDSIIGLPNDARLPSTMTVDLLLRRPVRLGGARSGVYVDVRNLLNRRNIVAVRRDTGQPGLTETGVQAMAEAAYQAHTGEIPYESARYRGFADIDGNGYLEGRDELFPLYLAAARDFTQPLFAYGPPRLVRLGVEFLF